MNLYEIRNLIGGTPMYSNEICRSEKGIAWYNGQFRVGSEGNEKFFSWEEISVDEARKLIKDQK